LQADGLAIEFRRESAFAKGGAVSLLSRAVNADIAGEVSGVVSGVMNTCCQMGGALTASLTPYLASRYGWKFAFLFGAAMALVGGFMWLLVDPTAKHGASARTV
jgi:MFS transporter, ACS family, glucarate transporter